MMSAVDVAEATQAKPQQIQSKAQAQPTPSPLKAQVQTKPNTLLRRQRLLKYTLTVWRQKGKGVKGNTKI